MSDLLDLLNPPFNIYTRLNKFGEKWRVLSNSCMRGNHSQIYQWAQIGSTNIFEFTSRDDFILQTQKLIVDKIYSVLEIPDFNFFITMNILDDFAHKEPCIILTKGTDPYPILRQYKEPIFADFPGSRPTVTTPILWHYSIPVDGGREKILPKAPGFYAFRRHLGKKITDTIATNLKGINKAIKHFGRANRHSICLLENLHSIAACNACTSDLSKRLITIGPDRSKYASNPDGVITYDHAVVFEEAEYQLLRLLDISMFSLSHECADLINLDFDTFCKKY